MNVLLVTFLVPHAHALSGAAVVIHGELTTLAERHEVTLVTVAAADDAESVALDELRTSGVSVHAVGGSLPPGLIRRKRRLEQTVAQLGGGRPVSARFSDPRIQRLVDRLLAQQPFDVVQVENIGLGRYRFDTHVPSVITEHEVGRFSSDGRYDWEREDPATWRQFDRIQVFTPRDAAEIRRVAPELADRVRVNPFGIDLPPDVDRSKEEAGAVVFVGGFDHGPNVDAALWIGSEIGPLLRRLSSGVRLYIVGRNPPKSVRALAGDDTIVTGQVPAIEPYLERAAVVLAPLRTGGGMRVKVLQAMALGKAVVTTPLGAEGIELAQGEPPLAVAAGAEEIATVTARLLASHDARSVLGNRARAFVDEHYSWSAHRRRLEAMYSELTAGRE
jgi:glycosyltransferase involved in cell wall biosynthesis